MYEILINPMSRSGKGIRVWHQIEATLKARHISYRVHFSTRKGDICRMAKELTAKPCKILVLGGDGTFNEFLQGVQNFDHTEAGFITLGSGNDLCRGLGYPRDPLQVLDSILACKKPMKMDVGVVIYRDDPAKSLRKRRFAISCGAGFDAAVCYYVDHSRIKKILNLLHLGKLSYLLIAVREIFTAKRTSIMLSTDHESRVMEHYLFAAAMNNPYEGGGFKFGPHANQSDGLMDLCVVGDIPPMKVLVMLPTAFFGKHFIFNMIDQDRSRETVIQAMDPKETFFLHTDGEVLGKMSYAKIGCEEKPLKLLWKK